ncbi:hypothetical protein HOD75_03225 [archaeon]|jgi:hypothetical protein|nr:hypothetical protein [archaeon]MBT4241885.1 hypothetical protein [archaeon]MBT4418432.1 hypothetical protein [archaeon]
MKGNKHAFWQALLIALLIFWLGILIGVFFENYRIENLEEVYFDSQTGLLDFELTSEIIYNSNLDCTTLNEKSVYFADNIYKEAIKLEKYDDSNKITKELITLHRRYDLLRTLLWNGIIENKRNCNESINTVVYLYQYQDASINKKGLQGAMSSHLIDLKEKYQDDIILIPIAVDTNVESLNILREIYDLDNFPVIIVNEKTKFETLDSLKDIEKAFELDNGFVDSGVIALN